MRNQVQIIIRMSRIIYHFKGLSKPILKNFLVVENNRFEDFDFGLILSYYGMSKQGLQAYDCLFKLNFNR